MLWASALVSNVSAPELASNMTSSLAVGTLAPPAPPDDVLQFAILFQSEVLLIKYLLAILYLVPQPQIIRGTLSPLAPERGKL
jgi:hypothetical protein